MEDGSRATIDVFGFSNTLNVMVSVIRSRLGLFRSYTTERWRHPMMEYQCTCEVRPEERGTAAYQAGNRKDLLPHFWGWKLSQLSRLSLMISCIRIIGTRTRNEKTNARVLVQYCKGRERFCVFPCTGCCCLPKLSIQRHIDVVPSVWMELCHMYLCISAFLNLWVDPGETSNLAIANVCMSCGESTQAYWSWFCKNVGRWRKHKLLLLLLLLLLFNINMYLAEKMARVWKGNNCSIWTTTFLCHDRVILRLCFTVYL